jgi:hypothetical protein
MREQLSGWRTCAGVAFYLVGGFNTIGGLAALFKVVAAGTLSSLPPTTRPGAGSSSSSGSSGSRPGPGSSGGAAGAASSASSWPR